MAFLRGSVSVVHVLRLLKQWSVEPAPLTFEMKFPCCVDVQDMLELANKKKILSLSDLFKSLFQNQTILKVPPLSAI